MKLEIFDINIVEQASISNFSKLDNIGTPPLRLLMFSDEAFVHS